MQILELHNVEMLEQKTSLRHVAGMIGKKINSAMLESFLAEAMKVYHGETRNWATGELGFLKR